MCLIPSCTCQCTVCYCKYICPYCGMIYGHYSWCPYLKFNVPVFLIEPKKILKERLTNLLKKSLDKKRKNSDW